MTAPVVRAPQNDDELRQCNRLGAVAFNGTISAEADEEWLGKAHRDRILGVFVGDELAAWSQVRPFGQFFGGRCVPMGGYSPVATAPAHRGHGYGSMITTAQFPHLRERGEVIAGLYPASTQLYRGTGFELAGVFTYRTLPSRSLHKLRPSGGVVVREATADDLPAIHACYRRHAATQPGWLDRPDVWWKRVLPEDKIGVDHFVYVVDGPGGELAGYVRYQHAKGKPPGYTIEVHEVCTEDPDVLLALWRLVGTSSTQAPTVRTSGPPEHPLLLLLPDQDLESTHEIRWMLRIIDGPGAIAARGFPDAVSATIELDLLDRQCDWNNGRWRLTVDGGSATLERGGNGDVALTVNALSSLYSGYASATTLRQVGAISRGDAHALAVLTAAFSGPTASIADFY